MTRIYEVESCFECPHYYQHPDKMIEYCLYDEEDERKLNTPTWESIDKDCPLPKKKEE